MHKEFGNITLSNTGRGMGVGVPANFVKVCRCVAQDRRYTHVMFKDVLV